MRTPAWLAPWELGPILAGGGAGTVFRARAPDGAAVAIKLLQGGEPLAEPARRRFQREAAALLRLGHPNLVRVHQVLEAQGRAALVMELVEGEDLEARLARGGPLPEREAARIGGEVARGLAHAHARGVIHRDLKPGNVRVTPEGRAVLVDFGLARDLALERSQLTRTGALLGTPGYWPPEQAAGQLERIGPASDVYGLGATLYALLTGVPPIQAASLPEALAAVIDREPPPLAAQRPGLDRELAAIVHRCLHKAPERRYPTADALADALAEWERRPLASPARRPGAAPLLAAGVLLIGAAGGALIVGLRARRATPAAVAIQPQPDRPAQPTGAGEDTARRELLQAARADIQAGRGREAGQRLEAWLAAHPTDRDALLLSLEAVRLGLLQPADALPAFTRALAHAPDSGFLCGGQASLLFYMARYPQAIEAAERALAALPASGPASVRGVALYVRGSSRVRLAQDYTAALADLDAALRAIPEHTQARMERGALRGLLRDHLGAVTDLDMALGLGLPGPDRPRAELMRGLALVQLRRRTEAAHDVRQNLPRLAADDPLRGLTEQLLGQVPTLPSWSAEAEANVAALLERAKLARESGGAPAALSLLEGEGAQFDHPSLHTLRGLLLIESWVPGPAEAALRRALELDPGRAEAWSALGALLSMGEGRAQEAIPVLWRALALNPFDTGAWRQLGTSLARAGRASEALLVYDQLVRLKPTEGEHWLARATLRARVGELPGALADVERAIAVGTRSGSTLLLRASLLDQLQRVDEALAAYQQALEHAGEPGIEGAQIEGRIAALRARGR